MKAIELKEQLSSWFLLKDFVRHLSETITGLILGLGLDNSSKKTIFAMKAIHDIPSESKRVLHSTVLQLGKIADWKSPYPIASNVRISFGLSADQCDDLDS